MTSPARFLDPGRDGESVTLPDSDGLPPSVHVIDRRSIDAINAALATARPLLVRGEPGTGKSQLARAAAVMLGRAFVPHAVDGRTETRDLLFTVDAVARLAEAQVMGALKTASEEEVRRRIDVSRFVRPGPLWWAFAWESASQQAQQLGALGTSVPPAPEGWSPDHGVVVLIDEIDKADAAVPNGLLDALGHGRFDVDGRGAVMLDRRRPPLVVITTNEERALSDAFLRRCLVLNLELPEERPALVELLVRRGRAHFQLKECADRILREAAELLASDREALAGQDVARPGLAEYIDLLGAVVEQAADANGQSELLGRVSEFALKKHGRDLAR